ncbi:methyltransferase domain-containing protein [candidate division WWE3 bacterium]|nr:methyltransferase domain-containing protein [candidate division WWE3 bacterium]
MNVFNNIAPPTVVYETQSKMNGKLQVVDRGKTRKLIAEGVVQSVNPDSPLAEKMYWGKVVEVIAENLGDSLNRVILFGLGGGTIPQLLSKRYPSVSIVSVEIDKEMVEISRKYFGLESLANLRIIIDDACRVATSPEEYGLYPNEFDAIIVNIFLGEVYPELGNSGSFFAGIKKFLRPGGLAVFNRIYLKHHQDDVNNFIENVSDYFSEVKSLVVAGKTNSDNVIIYGFV